MPRDFLHDLDDPDKANAFIIEADTPNTSAISRAQAASQLFLAYKTKLAGEALAASVSALAHAIEHAFADHAEALREAANASERHARGLNWATWALVGVTVLMFLTSAAQVYLLIYPP